MIFIIVTFLKGSLDFQRYILKYFIFYVWNLFQTGCWREGTGKEKEVRVAMT